MGEGWPQFDRLWVISDLHMGGPAKQQVFNRGTQLKLFIDPAAILDGYVPYTRQRQRVRAEDGWIDADVHKTLVRGPGVRMTIAAVTFL